MGKKKMTAPPPKLEWGKVQTRSIYRTFSKGGGIFGKRLPGFGRRGIRHGKNAR